MAYHPFYSSFTPFSSTIPPLSPNPYGYGYSSHYNHVQQPLLPYSQPQPPPYSPYTPPYSNPYTPLASLYSQSQPPPPSSPPFPYSQPQPPPLPYHSTCTPPPNPIEATILALTVKLDSIAGEISSLKTQHSSPNTQPPPQKPDSDSLPSIETSSFNGDSVEQFIVADRFVVHGTPPPPAVHLGTEAITSPTKWKSIKTTEVDKQSTISALKSPPLEPSESEKFRGRNGSSSTFESSFIRGLAAIFPSEPLDKEPPDKEPPPAAPKTPDLTYQQANSTKLPPPSESIPLNDLSSQQSPSSFTGVAFTKTKCHRNIPIVQSAEYQVSSHPLDQQRPRNGPSLPFISQQSQYPFLVPSASTTVSIQNSLARLSPSDRHLVSADIYQPSTNSTIRVLLSHWPSASHVSSFNSRTEMPPSSLQHCGSQLLPQNQNPMSHLTTKPAVFENWVPLLKIPAGQHVIPVWPPHTTDFYRANFACYEAGNLFPVGFTNVISACLAFLTMLPSVKQKEELIGYEVHAIPIREFKQWGECTVVTRIIPGAITFSPILYGYLNFNIGPPHKTLWNIEGTISTITADLIQLTRQQDMMVFLERLKKKKNYGQIFFFYNLEDKVGLHGVWNVRNIHYGLIVLLGFILVWPY